MVRMSANKESYNPISCPHHWIIIMLLFSFGCHSKTSNRPEPLQPGMSIHYLDSGNYARKNNDYERALILYRKAFVADTSNYEALFKIINLNLALKKYSLAISQCDTLEPRYSRSDDLFILYDIKSQAYMRIGQYKQALSYSDSAIKYIYDKGLDKVMEAGLLSWFYSDHAIINVLLHNDEKGQHDLLYAIKLDSTNYDIPFTRGIIELEKNNDSSACEYFEQAYYLGNPRAKMMMNEFCNKINTH